MIDTSNNTQRNAFARWLRTGQPPTLSNSDGLELKFNPWHDPADGRFTSVGAGHRYGARGELLNLVGGRDPATDGRLSRGVERSKPRAGTSLKEELPAGRGESTLRRRPLGLQAKRTEGKRREDRPNRVTEFVGGVGQGLYGVAEDTVDGIRDVLTTNPATTVRNAGRGVARMIDTAIAAEDTPARVQVARAANRVANASARDIGRFTGSAAGNVVLTVAPGAALSKVSALRSLRHARPRPTFKPAEIGWARETSKSTEPWKLYNDTAPGARPGLAPTLMRTMPDGSKRPVKFDGYQGDYLIDRKTKVVDAPHARAALMRQSQVLAEHGLFAVWEVPNAVQLRKAIKLFKRMNVKNIKVRIVKQ